MYKKYICLIRLTSGKDGGLLKCIGWLPDFINPGGFFVFMTVYTENEEEARLNYFSNLSLGGWCAFKDAAPYAHWLIEATPHPLSDESAIIRPVSNNNGTDQQYQWWRPAVFSCVPSRVGAIKT